MNTDDTDSMLQRLAVQRLTAPGAFDRSSVQRRHARLTAAPARSALHDRLYRRLDALTPARSDGLVFARVVRGAASDAARDTTPGSPSVPGVRVITSATPSPLPADSSDRMNTDDADSTLQRFALRRLTAPGAFDRGRVQRRHARLTAAPARSALHDRLYRRLDALTPARGDGLAFARLDRGAASDAAPTPGSPNVPGLRATTSATPPPPGDRPGTAWRPAAVAGNNESGADSVGARKSESGADSAVRSKRANGASSAPAGAPAATPIASFLARTASSASGPIRSPATTVRHIPMAPADSPLLSKLIARHPSVSFGPVASGAADGYLQRVSESPSRSAISASTAGATSRSDLPANSALTVARTVAVPPASVPRPTAFVARAMSGNSVAEHSVSAAEAMSRRYELASSSAADVMLSRSADAGARLRVVAESLAAGAAPTSSPVVPPSPGPSSAVPELEAVSEPIWRRFADDGTTVHSSPRGAAPARPGSRSVSTAADVLPSGQRPTDAPPTRVAMVWRKSESPASRSERHDSPVVAPARDPGGPIREEDATLPDRVAIEPGSSPRMNQDVDVEWIVEQVGRRLRRRLEVERERVGQRTWR